MPDETHHTAPERSGPTPKADTRFALLRFGGEVTLKSPGTRRRFNKRLMKNLKDALKANGIVAKIERDHDRVYVEAQSQGDLEQLANCFGIQSISLVERLAWQSMDDLVAHALALYKEDVRGKSFALRVRRVGSRSDTVLRSQETARVIGAALDEHAAKVDLKNPDIEIHVEIMPDWVYFFSEKIPGPAGLPVGVEGSAISLVSGGFDSAVASWLMLKRGVALDYVFCNMGGREHQLGVLHVMKQIADQWSYGLRPHLHSIDFDHVTRDLREKSEPRYWQILLKRLFLRTAEMVAAERSAKAIITGDAVGQVSSQTLQNISVISQSVTTPVLRPLVGFNKDEIIAIARKIGTEKYSKDVIEYCAMVPSKPATNAKLEVILKEEARLDPELLEQAVAERSVLNLRAFDLGAADMPKLEAHAIKEGTLVIDLRSAAAYKGWHYPGALHLNFNEALRAFPHFDKSKDYVLYCEFGLKSAHLAELMVGESMRATHFGHGLKDLVKYAKGQGLATPEDWS